MTRSRASAKQAGTRWESAIVDYLASRGWRHAERRAKTGALDKGRWRKSGDPATPEHPVGATITIQELRR